MDDQTPQGRRLRRGRHSQPGQIYLVTTVTDRRQRLFTDLGLGRCVAHTLRHQQDAGIADSLAFVVMPDHLHWLVQLHDHQALSRVMDFTKTMSARRINQLRGCIGAPVWQRGFHDHAVRREKDLLAIVRYVVANPLHAGLVYSIGDYPLWDAIWL